MCLYQPVEKGQRDGPAGFSEDVPEMFLSSQEPRIQEISFGDL